MLKFELQYTTNGPPAPFTKFPIGRSSLLKSPVYSKPSSSVGL